jgi:dihydroneopterin triphosphate diphosphatase
MNSFIDPHAISVFLIHNGRYLLIRRCCEYLTGTWQMVTGGIHQGEKAWEAVLREIKEETGVVPDRLYSADAVETFYMKSLDKIAFVPVFVAFLNEPGEIILSPTEHDAYEWLTYEQSKERLAWAEQKRVLSHIHENFVLKQPLSLNLIDSTLDISNCTRSSLWENRES